MSESNLLTNISPCIVTGAAGFIGSHLCDRLISNGVNVIAIDNLSFGSKKNLAIDSKLLSFYELDIRDKQEIGALIKSHQPKVLFHLAANASVPLSSEKPEFDFENNALGTVNILENLRLLSPSTKFILASSAAVYGEPGTTAITEQTPLMPISQYGLSKYIAELQSNLYFNHYGLPVVIARLFNCYGPRMPRFVVLDFLRKLKANPLKLEILGDGKQTRDFTYVSDTVEGLICCALKGHSGEAYNIASGTATSVTELANILFDVLGTRNQVKINYTGQSWSGDAQFWSVNCSKIKSIGYTSKVPLSAGLKKVTEWFYLSN